MQNINRCSQGVTYCDDMRMLKKAFLRNYYHKMDGEWDEVEITFKFILEKKLAVLKLQNYYTSFWKKKFKKWQPFYERRESDTNFIVHKFHSPGIVMSPVISSRKFSMFHAQRGGLKLNRKNVSVFLFNYITWYGKNWQNFGYNPWNDRNCSLTVVITNNWWHDNSGDEF